MTPHAVALQASAPAPVDAFARLSRRPGVFWLDSSLSRPDDGRFSIMGAEPRWVFTVRGPRWEWCGRDGVTQRGDNPLTQLDRLLGPHHTAPAAAAPHLPFVGGAVGWLSYDLGRAFEALEGTSVDDLGVPDLQLAWHDAAVVWDHANDEAWLVGLDGERPARDAMEELAGWLVAAPATGRPPAPATPGIARSDLSRAAYLAGVAQVRAGIARGEYYQLNLVQRFVCPHSERPAETYLRLRQANPAPWSAFLEAGDCSILSSSPERFIEVTPDGQVRTCPIKGTRPRGATPALDAELRAELLASEKERAELLMIVDLLRNDLGRVCVPGSVRVTRLHAIESFATVHHLVGEVHGQLRPGTTRRDWLRAVFPGGSITGAPKVSAMRAIDHLEPHRRGIGMGSIGYFSAHGRVDLNIAIRTIITTRGNAYVPLGAGIVWDSDPASEYAETLAKGRALFTALGVIPDES